MNFSSFINSIRTDLSTILGSSTVLGTGVAMLTHAVSIETGVPVLIGGMLAALMPQRAAVSTLASGITGDLIAVGAAVAHGQAMGTAVASALPTLARDAGAVLATLQAAHAATPPGGTTASSLPDGTTITTTVPPPPAPALTVIP